jgi:adenosylcobinamide-phosphate synthase
MTGTGRSRLPRPLGAAVGIVLDRNLPEPPSGVHPVAVFGRTMTRVEDALYRDSRPAGVAHGAVGVALGLGMGAAVRSTGWATCVAVAGGALAEVAGEIETALEEDDIVRARSLLPSMVGRDPTHLEAKDIARAVVESVAENTVDAVVAPALWGALAGAPGALGYRAVNTLDAMVGQRSPRYRNFGWASARLDDALGWAPARLTAALVGVVRPRTAGAVWRAVRTQAPAHPSPNAGVSEAAFAAALGLRLGGLNQYGDETELSPPLGTGRAAAVADIGPAVQLSLDIGGALAVGLGMLGVRQWLRSNR